MYGKLTGSFIIANSSESDDPTGCDRLASEILQYSKTLSVLMFEMFE